MITFRHGGDHKDLYLTALAALAALRKAWLKDHVRCHRQRSQNIQSFHDMMALMLEFVDAERG